MDDALAALSGYGDGGDNDDGVRSDDYYEMDIDAVAEMEFGSASARDSAETPSSSNTAPKTPLRQTPLMERAGTPVMSNNSKTGGAAVSGRMKGTSVISLKDDDDYHYHDGNNDEQMRMPVETPIQLRFKERGVLLGTGMKSAKMNIMAMMDTNEDDVPLSIPQSLNQGTFRRYHDALHSLLLTKRSVMERRELEQADLDTGALITGGSSFHSTTAMAALTTGDGLVEQQSKAEIHFCRTLCNIAYAADRPPTGTAAAASSPTTNQADDEGHLWNLLAVLAKLGQAALVWNDDTGSMTQHNSAKDWFLNELERQVNLTPKDIVEALKPKPTASIPSSNVSSRKPSPMVLQRKYRLVEWIRSCLDHEKKVYGVPFSSNFGGGNRSLHSKNHPDSMEPVLLSEMDAQTIKQLMETCLMHVLQGNVKEAQNLIRSIGRPWHAAAWGGGEPDGYDLTTNDTARTLERMPVGNPNRFLWKRQVWKTGRMILDKNIRDKSMSKSSQHQVRTIEEEAAIYSLLACDVDSALQNPCLRSSWTKSLCVLLSCMWDRVEDSTLHNFNKQRRLRLSPSNFPGSLYEQEEVEQLQATANLARMTDSQLLLKLEGSPHLQKQIVQQDPMDVSFKSIILAFIAGRSAIIDTCSKESGRLLATLEDGGNDWVGLRLLTHLLLFLSSIDTFGASFSSTLENYKNDVLFKYVQYLVTRPDLSHFCALYVHMLPSPKVLEFYPSILVRVLNNGERNLILQQIEEYMPNMMAQILQQVVRMALSADTYGDSDDPAVVDQIKCDSLKWLLQHEEHFGDALICANMLIRDFLNDNKYDKMEVAMEFLRDLPDNLWEYAGEVFPRYLEEQGRREEKERYTSEVNDARHEYSCYSSYLDSYRVFCEWKETIKETSPKSATQNGQSDMDPSILNEYQAIGQYHVQRNWINSKKEVYSKVLGAAEAAREALYKVLTFEGGWLYVEEDVDEDDSESKKKYTFDSEQFTRLQEIAAIRSRHLVSAVSFYHQVCEDTASWLCRSLDDSNVVGLTRANVLEQMEHDADPSFWYDRALDLAIVVAATEYKILDAFDQGSLQELLSKLAEVQVSKLMNK